MWGLLKSQSLNHQCQLRRLRSYRPESKVNAFRLYNNIQQQFMLLTLCCYPNN